MLGFSGFFFPIPADLIGRGNVITGMIFEAGAASAPRAVEDTAQGQGQGFDLRSANGLPDPADLPGNLVEDDGAIAAPLLKLWITAELAAELIL